MRIISDFHDYYDAVQATGQDQTLIYSRKREEVAISNYPFPVLAAFSLSPYYRDRYPLLIQQHIVGFCGKIYPQLVLSRNPPGQPAVCYDLRDVDCFVEQHFRRKEIEEYRTRAKRRWRWRWRYWPGDLRRDSLEEYFTECAAKRGLFAETFRERRCPVFVGTAESQSFRKSSGKIVYNACLKDVCGRIFWQR